MNNPLITPKEAAKILGLCVQTLYEWRVKQAKGQEVENAPHAIKIGGRYRYNLDEIKEIAQRGLAV